LTGIASFSSIFRCCLTSTSAETSTVRPSTSKNRKPYPPPGVSIVPGREINRTSPARSRSASVSTSAGLAAPYDTTSSRFSSDLRSRTT